MVLKVVPLRRVGGWRLCDIYRAEAWAVALFRKGHHMRILIRTSTKAAAEAQLEACQRAYEGIAVQRLGARMPKVST